MSKSTFYTNSKIKGYDIVHIDPRYLSYSLFLNYKDCDVDLYGEKPQKLSREKFDKLISSHKKYEVYDLLNYDPDNYERFYRESDWDCYTVDILEINHVTKEYTLAENVDDINTDGYDVIGNEVFSTDVSEIVFDAIVEGIKLQGFKEVEEFNDIVLR